MQTRLLWRSLRARRSRVLLALLAVTLGTGVATALGTLALQVGDDLARTLRAAGPNFVMRPEGASWRPDATGGLDVARAGVSLPENAVAALRSTFWQNNVLAAAPELDVRVHIAGRDVEATGTWFAHDLATAAGPWRTGLAALHPNWRIEGGWPEDTGSAVVLGRMLARETGARPGGELALLTAQGRETVRVAAIVDAGGLDDRRLWLPLAFAQRLSGRAAQVDRVALSALIKPEPVRAGGNRPPDQERDPEGYERYMCTAYPGNVARDLADAVPGSEVVQMTELVAGEAGVVWRLNLLMLLLALAALTASTLGLVSTTTAGVIERAREFGLMRALGATSAQLATLLLTESLVVALAGGALGWLLGTGTAALIRGDAFAAPAAAQPLLLPLALLVAAAVAVAGTIGPMRLALRFDPIEALRA